MTTDFEYHQQRQNNANKATLNDMLSLMSINVPSRTGDAFDRRSVYRPVRGRRTLRRGD
ncbi:MAG: hypothetical protein WCK14_02110 [Actinomycetota bacterium]|jgi:hypothetical protein